MVAVDLPPPIALHLLLAQLLAVHRLTLRLFLIAPRAVWGTRVPKPVPDCSFPKSSVLDGDTGKIALNEWPLSGDQIDTLDVRVWAF